MAALKCAQKHGVRPGGHVLKCLGLLRLVAEKPHPHVAEIRVQGGKAVGLAAGKQKKDKE